MARDDDDFIDDDDAPATRTRRSNLADIFDDDSDDDLPTLGQVLDPAWHKAQQSTKGKGKARDDGPSAGAGNRATARRALGKEPPRRSGKSSKAGYAWEANYKRSWDAVQEDESGGLAGAVKTFLEAAKRRRCGSVARELLSTTDIATL